MRMLDDDTGTEVTGVTVYLSTDDLQGLLGATQALVNHGPGNHVHVSSSDYQRELTICVYDEDSLATFDARSRALIEKDLRNEG